MSFPGGFRALVRANVFFFDFQYADRDQCPFSSVFGHWPPPMSVFHIFWTLAPTNVFFRGISDIGRDQCLFSQTPGHWPEPMSREIKIKTLVPVIARNFEFFGHWPEPMSVIWENRTLTAINVAIFYFRDIGRVQRLYISSKRSGIKASLPSYQH
jgi:hypothetical protein